MKIVGQAPCLSLYIINAQRLVRNPIHRPCATPSSLSIYPCVPCSSTPPPVRPHLSTQPPVRDPGFASQGGNDQFHLPSITRRDRPLYLSFSQALSPRLPCPTRKEGTHGFLKGLIGIGERNVRVFA